MRRDLDLIRTILVRVADGGVNQTSDLAGTAEMRYHVRLALWLKEHSI